MSGQGLGKLLDRTVSSIYLSEDQSILYLCIGYKGESCIEITTEADCCSETWFADIIGVDNIIGQRVSGVELLDLPSMNDYDPRSRQEYDIVYGFRLKTEKGDCDFIYRNSSNGYYGGWIQDIKKIAFDDMLPNIPVYNDVSF